MKKLLGIGVTIAVVVALMPATGSALSLSRETIVVDHSIGEIETTSITGGALRRSVEVWVAGNGSYLAITRSLDATGAGETVSYDGQGTQSVLITDPSGNQRVIATRGSAHFAVDGTKPAGPWQQLDPGGTITYTVAKTSRITVLPGKLLLKVPNKVAAEPYAGLASTHGGNQTLSGGVGHGQTFYTLSGQPCVYGYNYRDPGSNYFRGSTSVQASCSYGSVSLWNHGYPGAVCGGVWEGAAGPGSYASKTAYFEVLHTSDGHPACSNHAGWDYNWVIQVAWVAFTAAVPG